MAKRKTSSPRTAVAAPLPTEKFIPLVGHARAIDRLRQAARVGRLGHAYLFAGPDGIGKRRVAKHFAQALLCETRPVEAFDPCGRCAGCVQVASGSHPDLMEVRRPDDKTELPISLMQELVAQIALKPSRGRHKVAIVDDAGDMNDESANCFLKTLEEPPPGSVLILLSTSVDAQLPTILSRCQVLRFDPLPQAEVAEVVRALGVAATDQEAQRIASLGNGSVGLAIELAQPEWIEFRARLARELTADKVRNTNLAQATLAFLDAAGKESAAKRSRAGKVIGLTHAILRDALLAACDPSQEIEDASIALFGRRVGVDVLADLIDRSIEADYHVSRQAQLPLAVETWLDDLGRITAGQYVPSRV